MRKPIGYLVQQRGLGEYAETCRTKKEAIQIAREGLWWSRHITVRPVYAGRPIKWISDKELRRRCK